MINSNPDQKNWDGIWSPVGEVQQAVREGAQIDEVLGFGTPDYPGKPGAMSRLANLPKNFVSGATGRSTTTGTAFADAQAEAEKKVAQAYVQGDPNAKEMEEKLFDTYFNHPDSIHSGYGGRAASGSEDEAHKVRSATGTIDMHIRNMGGDPKILAPHHR